MTNKKHTIQKSIALLLTGVLAVAFGANENDFNPDFEQIINRYVGIVNMQTIFDASIKSNSKLFPRNIESIAWNKNGTKLLIDYQGVNQYFAIADLSSALNGGPAKVKILTNNRDSLNTRLNNSNPAFYPNGKYYVFSGQDSGVNEYKRSLPGYAFFSNLCMGELKSNIYWQLTTYVSTQKAAKGALMPQFSPDGSKLLWTTCSATQDDKLIFGQRSIMLADFAFNDGTPKLSNPKKLGDDQITQLFAEGYEFSPDGKQILLSGSQSSTNEWYGMDLGVISLETGETKFLTNSPKAWDRYATFSSTGKKIIWGSSEGYSIPYLGIGGSQWQNEICSEIWIMNADGTDKRQLSRFNERGTPHYAGCKCYVGMIKAHPTEKNKIAFILHKQHSINSTSSSIIIAELGNTLLTTGTKNK